MTRFTVHVSLFTLLLATPGCGQTSQEWYRRPAPVEALPDRLVPDTANGAPAEVTTACISPLLDTIARVRFRLHQSVMLDHGPIGDYIVEPAGSYGLSSKQAVRVDCAIGRPLGTVPR